MKSVTYTLQRSVNENCKLGAGKSRLDGREIGEGRRGEGDDGRELESTGMSKYFISLGRTK